jgi:subtilase family serine protease
MRIRTRWGITGAAVAALGFAAAIPAGSGAVSAPARTTAVARPQLRTFPGARFATAPTTVQCREAFGINCYSPLQIETAYQTPSLYRKGVTGTGETIALVDSYGSPTIQSDLATFDAAYGLPAPPSFSIITPAGKIPPFDPTNSTMVGWAEETSLDVEYAHAMAPGANLLLVETPVAETIGVQGFPQIVKAENYVVDHGLADVISQSFAAAERSFPSASSILSLRSAYVNAAVHQVTVLGAAGDDGATSPSNAAGSSYYTTQSPNWPASDPLVTAVGGTQLFLNGNGSHQAPDVVWNDTSLLGSPAAGGGGISTVFARPSYQTFHTPGDKRELPDVSMSAAVNGGVLVYMSFGGLPAPDFYIIGGTSEATPLFAGVVALADQVAGRPLGLLNPTLYALEAAGAPGIVDVTTGNNTVTFAQGKQTVTVPGYVAGTGYDLASGVGTVDAAALVPELAAGSAASGS